MGLGARALHQHPVPVLAGLLLPGRAADPWPGCWLLAGLPNAARPRARRRAASARSRLPARSPACWARCCAARCRWTACLRRRPPARPQSRPLPGCTPRRVYRPAGRAGLACTRLGRPGGMAHDPVPEAELRSELSAEGPGCGHAGGGTPWCPFGTGEGSCFRGSSSALQAGVRVSRTGGVRRAQVDGALGRAAASLARCAAAQYRAAEPDMKQVRRRPRGGARAARRARRGSMPPRECGAEWGGMGSVRAGVSRCDVGRSAARGLLLLAFTPTHVRKTGTARCRAPGPGGRDTEPGRAAERGARARGRQRAQQDLQAMAAGFHAAFRRYALLTPPAWLRAVDGGAVRQVRRGGAAARHPGRGGRRAWRAPAAATLLPPRSATRRPLRGGRPRAGRRCCLARAARPSAPRGRGGAAWRARRPAGPPPADGRRAAGDMLLHSWLGCARRRLTPLRRGRC